MRTLPDHSQSQGLARVRPRPPEPDFPPEKLQTGLGGANRRCVADLELSSNGTDVFTSGPGRPIQLLVLDLIPMSSGTLCVHHHCQARKLVLVGVEKTVKRSLQLSQSPIKIGRQIRASLVKWPRQKEAPVCIGPETGHFHHLQVPPLLQKGLEMS